MQSPPLEILNAPIAPVRIVDEGSMPFSAKSDAVTSQGSNSGMASNRLESGGGGQQAGVGLPKANRRVSVARSQPSEKKITAALPKVSRNVDEIRDRSDVEGRSFFKCCYSKRHQDEEVSEAGEKEDKNVDEQHDYQEGSGQLTCKGCPTCQAQIKYSVKFQKKVANNEHYYNGREDMAFDMLIHELIAKPKDNPKEKMLSGCEVFFPDTLFFKNQQPSYIIMMDKDFCLTKWNDEEKKVPNANDFIQKIEKATKVRKANKQRYWLQYAKQARLDQVNRVKYANDPNVFTDDAGADAVIASPGEDDTAQKERGSKIGKKSRSSTKAKEESNKKQQDMGPQQGNNDPQKKHRDDWFAWIRFQHYFEYKDDGNGLGKPSDPNTGNFEQLQAISIRGFTEIVPKLRATTGYYTQRMIQYIQSGVKANPKTRPYNITIKFKAPLDETDEETAAREICYESFRLENEMSLLKSGQFEKYAQVQCLKMCYYLQKVRQLEILKMTVEFVRDDYDNIWFIYANHISYRRIYKNYLEGFSNDIDAEKQNVKFQTQQTDLFTRELQDYQEAIEAQRENYVTNRMREFMHDYYTEMKRDMGLDAGMGEHEDLPPLETVLQQLKPNLNPKNFAEFMKKKHNHRKDFRNKQIARKMQTKQADEDFRNTALAKHFQSARTVRHLKHPAKGSQEPREVEDILTALEIVNKEAIKTGLGGGLHGPASKVINGINMLKAKNTNGPLGFLSEQPLSTRNQQASAETMQGARFMSNYKAELVRQNIVTRTDLMKLYHPPVRKSQLPSRDPFQMRKIVPRPESMSNLHNPGMNGTTGTQMNQRDQRNMTSLAATGQFPALGKMSGSLQPKSVVSGAESSLQFLDSQHSEQELILKHEKAIKASQMRRASYNPQLQRAKMMRQNEASSAMQRATGRTQPTLEMIYKRKQYLAAQGPDLQDY